MVQDTGEVEIQGDGEESGQETTEFVTVNLVEQLSPGELDSPDEITIIEGDSDVFEVENVGSREVVSVFSDIVSDPNNIIESVSLEGGEPVDISPADSVNVTVSLVDDVSEGDGADIEFEGQDVDTGDDVSTVTTVVGEEEEEVGDASLNIEEDSVEVGIEDSTAFTVVNDGDRPLENVSGIDLNSEPWIDAVTIDTSTLEPGESTSASVVTNDDAPDGNSTTLEYEGITEDSPFEEPSDTVSVTVEAGDIDLISPNSIDLEPGGSGEYKVDNFGTATAEEFSAEDIDNSSWISEVETFTDTIEPNGREDVSVETTTDAEPGDESTIEESADAPDGTEDTSTTRVDIVTSLDGPELSVSPEEVEVGPGESSGFSIENAEGAEQARNFTDDSPPEVTVENLPFATLDPGEIDPFPSVEVDDNVTPPESYTVTITAEGTSSDIEDSVVLDVEVVSEPTNPPSITVTGGSGEPGETITYSIENTGGDTSDIEAEPTGSVIDDIDVPNELVTGEESFEDLVISSSAEDGDSEDFTITAENDGGSDSGTGTVTVSEVEPPDITTDPSSFTTEPGNTVATTLENSPFADDADLDEDITDPDDVLDEISLLPDSIDSGQAFSITFDISSSASDGDEADVEWTATNDGGTSTASVDFTVDVEPPDLSSEDVEAARGEQVDSTITNSGDEATSVDANLVFGTGDVNIISVPSSIIVSRDVTVEVDSDADGTGDSVKVEGENEAGNDDTTFQVTVLEPELDCDPCSDTVSPGNTSTQMELVNTGDLEATGITTQGVSNEFSVSGVPTSLDPGESENITVTDESPFDEITHTFEIVSDNAGPVEFELNVQ